MPRPTDPEANTDLRIPDNLMPRAAEAHRVILGVIRRFRATFTGGCRAFYSRREWRERGEAYGTNAHLIVAYDGGDLSDFFRLGGDEGRWRAMDSALRAVGLYAEECTGWYAAIYPVDRHEPTQSIEWKRIGRTHRWEVAIDGIFTAFITRAAFGKSIGAFWAVTTRADLPEVRGSFATRTEAAAALLRELGPEGNSTP